MKINWDEDEELEGIDLEGDEIPDYALDGSGRAAAIVESSTGMKWQEPIWLHPEPAFELDEAGVLNMLSAEAVEVDDTTVYVYAVN